MSYVVVSKKTQAKIARSTGLEIVRASGSGGYWLTYTTADHRHGKWNVRTHEAVEIPCPHFASCSDMFGRVSA